MSKILLPLKNSTWGVIVHQVGADEYEHVLSFQDDVVKKDFISQELFGFDGFDYVEAINKMRNRSFVKLDELSGHLTIDLDDINTSITLENGTTYELNYTMNDLLAIDCLFVLEDDKVNLYAVASATKTSEQNNQSITFELSLDVMFNSIDELEIEGNVWCERAMVDRVKSVDTDTVEFNFDNDLNNKYEQVEEKVIPVKYSSIKYSEDNEYSLYQFLDENGVHDEELKQEVLKTNWVYMYLATQRTETDESNPAHPNYVLRNGGVGTGPSGAVNVFVAPVGYEKFILGYDGTSTLYANTHDLTEFAKSYIGTDVKYYSSSQLPPFKMTFKRNGSFIEIRDTDSALSPIGFDFYDTEIDKDLYINVFNIETVQSDDDLLTINNIVNSEFNKTEFVSFNHKYYPDHEIKLITSHTKFGIFARTGNREFRIGDIGNHAILDIAPPLNMWNYGISIRLLNEELKGDSTSRNLLNHDTGIDIYQNNELPRTTSEWLEYQAEKSVSGSAGFITDIGKVAAGVLLAPETGGLSAGLAVGGVADIAGKIFERKDMKNAPDKVSGISELISTPEGIEYDYDLAIRELIHNDKQYIIDYYRMLGNRIDELVDLNEYLKNRYHWNYIKTHNIFSLIKNRYSASRKQVINDAFRVGFTIWHVRDLTSFKGIGNYEYENSEISLIE